MIPFGVNCDHPNVVLTLTLLIRLSNVYLKREKQVSADLCFCPTSVVRRESVSVGKTWFVDLTRVPGVPFGTLNSLSPPDESCTLIYAPAGV